jgi:uncharacterized membrane protein
LTLRDALLVIHIAGAGTWLGTNVVQAFIPPYAARSGNATLGWWYRTTAVMSSRLYIPAAILILVSGIFLVLQNDSYQFRSTFVVIGLGMIVVGAVLGMVIFAPSGEEAAAAAEADDESRLRRAAGRITRYGVVDTLLLLFTITVMVLRFD